MKSSVSIAVIVILGLISAGCRSGVESGLPLEASDPTIVFQVTGGFAGVQEKLTIDPSGVARYETMYPVLEMQLSIQQRDSIEVLLKNFERYKDSYPSEGVDIFHYAITLTASGRTKTVGIDQLAFDNNPDLALLFQLIGKLWAIQQQIFTEKCPWLGLKYEFSLDSAAYHAGAPITISCRVTNPTTTSRTLYFRGKNELQFFLKRMTTDLQINATIPEYAAVRADTLQPHQITLAPGASRDLSLRWNQSFVNGSDGKAYTSLEAGSYALMTSVIAGGGRYFVYASDVTLKFQIIN